MYVVALRVELRIPNVQSLKGKRAIVKSVINQIGQQTGVAAAEVDHQDLWQRTAVGVSAVSAQAGHLQRIIHSIERDLRRRPDIEVLDVFVDYLEDPS
jgi:uncharacterized protein YlxP (DUF503 family)